MGRGCHEGTHSLVIYRFGFISFNDVKEATRAISDHDGTEVDGMTIALRYAEERGDRTPGGGGGRGGGGGWSGGRGFGGRGRGGRGRGRGELLLEKFIVLLYRPSFSVFPPSLPPSLPPSTSGGPSPGKARMSGSIQQFRGSKMTFDDSD